MLGHFQPQRRKIDHLTAAMASSGTLFQRMVALLAFHYRVNDRVGRPLSRHRVNPLAPFLP